MATLTDETPHSAFRREVREKSLQVATEQLNNVGWDQVHMTGVAQAVGVSRPTLYAEFGDKDGLAEALVLAETEKFLTGVAAILARYNDKPIKAVERATAYTLREADNSVLLRALLTSGTAENRGSDSLLTFVTVRAEPILAVANSAMFDWFKSQTPQTPDAQLAETVDSLVRLVISHLMAPAKHPSKTPAKLGRLTSRLLPDLADD